MSFLKEVIKTLDNEYASIASDGVIGEVEEYIDTGSYSFNAVVSGSIYGGIPANKITILEGESSTGKTYYMLGLVKNFLRINPTGGVIYFESESAVTKQTLKDRDIPLDKFVLVPVNTVEEFRTQCMRILCNYDKTPKKERLPLMICLDSLGMLSTNKEIEDMTEGKDTKDMTRTQLTKGAFRAITLKLGRLGVPLVATNHVYATMDLYSVNKGSGGSGPTYSASAILALSKIKDKDKSTGEHHGNIIKARVKKSRFTIEESVAETQLDFVNGLNRYYGLVDFALDAGIWKKSSTKIQVSDGSTHFEKSIYKNPEKYFTKEVLDQIDQYCKKKFLFGNGRPIEIKDEE